MRLSKKAEALRHAIAERRWYQDHGGSLTGYIARYGDPGVTEKWFGEGGTRIHEADYNALVGAERRAGITR